MACRIVFDEWFFVSVCANACARSFVYLLCFSSPRDQTHAILFVRMLTRVMCAGMVEPWGIAFDLLNAAIAGIRDKWIDMSLSLAGAIPGVGTFFVALKNSIKMPAVKRAVQKFIDTVIKLKAALIENGKR